MNDDFYVGYLARTSPALARWLRKRALALLVLFTATAALLVSSMSRFSAAAFEFGVERRFEGTLVEGAVPSLLVERPGAAEASAYLLVAFGKFGAHEAIAGLGGHRVRLKGSLVYRDDQTMIELVDGSVEDLGVGDASPTAEPGADGGEVKTLVGEIVDSKCFLGVMKPGNLKPHRACAVRCISGGIPPVLVVRDEEGTASYYLLVSESGEAVNEAVLDLVAEPVEITGRVVRKGTQSFLYADPEDYRAEGAP